MHSRQFENSFVNDFSLVWEHSFAAASIIVNCMLLFILNSSKKSEIGSYRHLLAFFCIFDIYFTIVHWLVYPNTMIVRGHGIFSSRLGPSIYIAAYQTALPIIAFNFVYRKLAITSPQYLNPPGRFFALMAISIFTANCTCLCINYYIAVPDEISVRALAPLFEGTVSSPLVHFNSSAWDCMIAQYWEGETFSKPRWRTFFGVVVETSFSFIAYSAILYCGFIVNTYLKSNATNSRTRKLHRQLFLSLVCQAAYPLVFNYFPIYVCLVLPIFGISASWASISIPLCCASHPFVDPIFVIICTSDFRKAFIRYFTPCRNVSRTGTTPSISFNKQQISIA